MKKINKISIRLSSPEFILNNSYGEVLNHETINYKTHKPEINGLFCEKIFGPVKNYECSCGKYNKKRYKGIFCDICGVEITKKNVRRKRFGHIKLSVPIVHIWSFKCLPNKISYLLNKTSKEIEDIIYYEKYIIIEINNFKYKKKNGKILKKFDLINEEEYYNIKEYIYNNNIKNKIIIKTGGKAIYSLLKNININKLFIKLKKKYLNEKSIQKKNDILKRLHVVELFKEGKKKNKPEYMVISILPVIPPDLRPLVLLDNGKYASSDLNDFYRKIIIRNNRLKKLISIKAPNVILKNEKRMLQESVDSLFDNSRRNLSVKSDNNRILKSFSDILKGKQGRFRQNLLGKRVDYSARSVIVVEPNLKLYECGLPKEIALELYKPFIIRKLIDRGNAKTIKSAKKIINKKKKYIWNILKKIIKGHPILLNRAPTLHRFSIQAFYPILINEKSIKLHPLICSAFNADFDGDQMAIHLPLSIESILEAQLLMLSPQNILNISNGSPIIIPSQDIILGLYYLTIKKNKNKKKQNIKIFGTFEEVIISLNLKKVKIHDNIKFKFKKKILNTTIGRVIFNNIIPKKKYFFNILINKINIKKIIEKVLYNTNIYITSNFLDNLKQLGLNYAFKGGLSFNINDIITPKEKKNIILKTLKKINKIFKHYNMGLITNNERYNQIIDEWSNTTTKITNIVINNMKNDKKELNNVYMMLDSGARSSKEQIRQLSGMRGLMAKPQKYNLTNGEIIENPIISNFIEGLSILEYFISTHGARKGLADTALKTADAGYLTRRLVDVAQDIIIKEKDCKTIKGITINNLNKKNYYTKIFGRTVLLNIKLNNKNIIKKNKIINYKLIKKIKKYKLINIKIRSPLTCETKNGICSKCYGSNLSNNKLIRIGETVGVIAAQSIGEPGTQLTLRTFHVGGSASNISEETEFISKYKGIIYLKFLKYIKKKRKKKNIYIVISRYTEINIIKNKKILYNNNIPYGSILFFKNKDKINIGDKIYEWDPYNAILISEYNGIVKYNNIKKYITYKLYKDKKTGFNEKIIIESKNKNFNPSLIIKNLNNKKLKNYNLPIGSYLNVKNNEKIKKGKILIKIPRINYKSKDITGGLPRLSELFEARNPINKAIVSEIDGIVKYNTIKKGSVEIIIKSSKFNIKKKYIIKTSKQILVQNNDYIKHGTQLSEGIISLNDILYIKGINKLQKYLINKLQKVYKSQGVQINNKHFEIIVNQMIKKVKIINSGDTKFIKGSIINKEDFLKENNKNRYMVVIEKNIYKDKKFYKGKLINKIKLEIKNEYLKMLKKEKIISRKPLPALAKPILQGITKSALYNKSFISSASFQETTKILSESAISGKIDYLLGLKENVIIGKKIPAGTGFKKFNKFKVKYKTINILKDLI
ncbi:MAG: DNA-directed RNA polymerase subunit beta' [Candidatus Shikimatogenerans bostrichidophilus]|nr:MAG: DNA-directed RNA polymerase subunit beta' [Candidatus Shikimatogenerans bostrichidophilus]